MTALDPVDAAAATLFRDPGHAADELPLSEVFHTIQGEGPACGRQAVFVRLGLCNLSCAWCDTPYTWDSTRFDVNAECPPTPAETIVTAALRASEHLPGVFVISGGEPLMHQQRPGWKHLVERLMRNAPVHVETNGTIAPNPVSLTWVSLFVVSPKLTNNGSDPASKRLKSGPLAAYAMLARHGRAVFKFVVSDLLDLTEVERVIDTHQLPRDAVWIMPEGVTADDVLDRHRHLIDAIVHHGFNTTTRLHTLLWGSERAK